MPISELESHLGYWLRFVSNHVSQAFQHKVEARGVTVAEWVVLRELLRLGEIHPSQLAESLRLTRGAVSKLIDRLLAKELVTRSVLATDRRFQTVTLTTSGRKLVPELAKLADVNDRQFFGHLSQKERAQLTLLLRNLAARHGFKDTPLD